VDAAKEKSVSLLNPLKQLFMAILSAQKSPKANAYQLKDAMKQFIEELRRRNEMFREPVHHDAHELFNYLINEIITEVKEDHTSFVISRDEEIRNVKGTRRKYFRTGHDLSTVEIDDRDDAESSVTAENDLNRHKRKDTWVHELFEGVLSNEIRCVQCETVSSRLEPFLDLSVDIPPTQQNCSILSSLKEFSKIEIMGGRGIYFL
jgi:ubiquitin C-terminal hydrolase